MHTYYGLSLVGHNTHEKFISRIAKNCGQKEFGYTNHSLRVSAICPHKNNFSSKQIINVTGHMSSTSLKMCLCAKKELGGLLGP